MLVSELRELLETMPETARVVALIRSNVHFDGTLRSWSAGQREADVVSVKYDKAEVLINVDEL